MKIYCEKCNDFKEVIIIDIFSEKNICSGDIYKCSTCNTEYQIEIYKI